MDCAYGTAHLDSLNAGIGQLEHLSWNAGGAVQHHKQRHQSLAEWQRKRKERQCLPPLLVPRC